MGPNARSGSQLERRGSHRWRGVRSSGTVRGPKKYLITNHGYQTFISAFESHKSACIPFLILFLRKEKSGKRSV